MCYCLVCKFVCTYVCVYESMQVEKELLSFVLLFYLLFLLLFVMCHLGVVRVFLVPCFVFGISCFLSLLVLMYILTTLFSHKLIAVDLMPKPERCMCQFAWHCALACNGAVGVCVCVCGCCYLCNSTVGCLVVFVRIEHLISHSWNWNKRRFFSDLKLDFVGWRGQLIAVLFRPHSWVKWSLHVDVIK